MRVCVCACVSISLFPSPRHELPGRLRLPGPSALPSGGPLGSASPSLCMAGTNQAARHCFPSQGHGSLFPDVQSLGNGCFGGLCGFLHQAGGPERASRLRFYGAWSHPEGRGSHSGRSLSQLVTQPGASPRFTGHPSRVGNHTAGERCVTFHPRVQKRPFSHRPRWGRLTKDNVSPVPASWLPFTLGKGITR